MPSRIACLEVSLELFYLHLAERRLFRGREFLAPMDFSTGNTARREVHWTSTQKQYDFVHVREHFLHF